MKRLLDNEKAALIRKFHALLREGGISEDEKLAMLGGYGVESSKDMNAYELLELCDRLHAQIHPQVAEGDKWRKRVIAAVADYLQAMGNAAPSMDLIKGVACRAAGYESFNKIPNDRLKSIYNAFKHRSKDIRTVAETPLFVTEWQA